MQIRVSGNGWLTWPGGRVRCALGRSGVREDKHEGDGATPAGSFPLRRVLYRADRLGKPKTLLAVSPLAPENGWCDDPDDPAYNSLVRLPYPGRCERLWREDHLYDLLAVLGYNDSPPTPGLGSAIFLHIPTPEYAPTEGCVAVALRDLSRLLDDCDGADRMIIKP